MGECAWGGEMKDSHIELAKYLHWLPSCAPNATSIFASGLLLLSTATSRGDRPSLFTLKIQFIFGVTRAQKINCAI